MERWQLHTLNEVEETDSGKRIVRQLGGTIVGLKILSCLGQLDSIDVIPADKEDIECEHWSGQYVKVRLADRQFWLDPEEVKTLVDLLETALMAAVENVDTYG